ncbi:MAG: CRTAC1 family protein [Chloroflexota bacterium]
MNRRRTAVIGGALAITVIATGSLFAARRLGALGGSAPTTVPLFVEEAAGAGLDHRYEGDYQYYVGGGVASFDCDADGQPELYLAGGSGPAALFRNESPPGGALRFTRVASATTDLDAVTGAYPLDVDGDGVTDLAVLRVGESVILRGLGDCRFERANESLGVDAGVGWTVAFSAMWEARNALPTLAFGRYVTVDEHGDATYTCPPNVIVRPSAGGVGYAPPIALAPGWCPLSMLFSDWSRSGRRDLRVSNDRHYYTDASGGEEQLWRIGPGEAPRLYTADDGWKPLRIWGMGIASQDLTGDGYPEVYLTSQGDNKLQTLADAPAPSRGPTYRDSALARGVIATRPFAGDEHLPSTAWHAQFEDVNNDSLPDLLVTKGNVDAEIDMAAKDPTDLFLGNGDGTFREAAGDAGLLTFAKGRGAAIADFNLDGLLDVVEVTRRENVKLWRNVGAGTAAAPRPLGNWVSVQLEQPRPNADAIGSWIEIRAGDRSLQREVTVGGGHASGQLGWIQFGLGSAPAADVRVTWPDGEVGPWQHLDAGSRSTIRRGAPEPIVWTGRS